MTQPPALPFWQHPLSKLLVVSLALARRCSEAFADNLRASALTTGSTPYLIGLASGFYDAMTAATGRRVTQIIPDNFDQNLPDFSAGQLDGTQAFATIGVPGLKKAFLVTTALFEDDAGIRQVLPPLLRGLRAALAGRAVMEEDVLAALDILEDAAVPE